MVADPLTAAAYNRPTAFASWRQCGPPSNTGFPEPTPLTIPNDSSIGSADFARPMPHSPCSLHCTKNSENICPFPWRGNLWTWTHRSLAHPTPNGISIESTVFPKYTLVSNGQTNRRTDRTNTEININRALRYIFTQRRVFTNPISCNQLTKVGAQLTGIQYLTGTFVKLSLISEQT